MKNPLPPARAQKMGLSSKDPRTRYRKTVRAAVEPLLARAELVRAEAVAAVVAARRRRNDPAEGAREQRDEAAPE